MAKVFCKYHSNIPARFHCKSCNVDLCSTCYKLEETKDGKKYVCPICLRPLTSLGMQNAITPFWERLPKFFSFPFNRHTLIFMFAISMFVLSGFRFFASFTFGALFIKTPILGGVLLFLFIAGTLFWFFRYAFGQMIKVSNGYIDAESATEEFNPSISVPLQMTFFIIIFTVGMGFLAYKIPDPKVILIISIICGLFWPAFSIMLAVTKNILHAINPLALGFLIKTVFGAYLILLVLIELVLSGWGTFYYLMLKDISFDGSSLIGITILVYILIPLTVFLSAYFYLVIFLMKGYLIYQYHEKLGYKVDVDFDDTDESKVLKYAGIINNEVQEINILLHEGKIEEAKSRLYEKIKKTPNNIKLQETLHNILIKLGEYDNLSKHGQKFIVELIRKERFLQAAKICDNCAAHDKNFKISDPYHSITIAEEAIKQGYYKTVVQLLNGFDKRFPSSPNMDKAAFLLAKSVCEGLGKDEIAIKILTNTINSFPGSKLIQEMKEYLEFVKKLHASKG